MTTWKQKGEETISRDIVLLRNILEVEGFADKVEQFGMLLNGDDVRYLAGDLFKIILSKEESKKGGDEYPGFFQLWRLSLDKPFAGHEKWILDEISKALPVSLLFANELYYYWRNTDRSMDAANVSTPELRNKVVAKAEEIYSGKSDILIKVLNIEDMYSTRTFMIFFSERDGGGLGYKPDEWRWFAAVILEAGKKNPQVVVPHIAGLVVDSE